MLRNQGCDIWVDKEELFKLDNAMATSFRKNSLTRPQNDGTVPNDTDLIPQTFPHALRRRSISAPSDLPLIRGSVANENSRYRLRSLSLLGTYENQKRTDEEKRSIMQYDQGFKVKVQSSHEVLFVPPEVAPWNPETRQSLTAWRPKSSVSRTKSDSSHLLRTPNSFTPSRREDLISVSLLPVLQGSTDKLIPGSALSKTALKKHDNNVSKTVKNDFILQWMDGNNNVDNVEHILPHI